MVCDTCSDRVANLLPSTEGKNYFILEKGKLAGYIMPFYLREVVTDLFYSLELLYSHLKN